MECEAGQSKKSWLPENDDGSGVILFGDNGEDLYYSGVLTRSLRSRPPSDFILKINSFQSLASNLSKGPIKKYDSGIFEVGGYKWKLSIYPQGDKKENEDDYEVDYISLYLVLAEDLNSRPHDFELNVIFKLFMYNYVTGQYFIVQDGVGMVRRFDKMNMRWGFPRFMPVGALQYAPNGFVQDLSCAFGAEVFVLGENRNTTAKVECLSTIDEQGYSWKIDNVSKMDQPPYHSPTFDAIGYKWRLGIYPKGGWKNQDKHLGMYLQWMLEDENKNNSIFSKIMRWFKGDNPEDKLIVTVTMLVRNQLPNGQHHKIIGILRLDTANTKAGLEQFMPLSVLNDLELGFIIDDSMIVEAKFTPIFNAHNIATAS